MPLPTKDESYPLKVHYNIQVRFILMAHLRFAQQLPRCFQNLCWLVQLSFASALARLMWEMLLHHTPSLENFHGLLSMSSCMVCPCFCISASVSQLASSTGWFFHLTRYSKYCFPPGPLTHSLVQYALHLWLLCNWHLLHPLDHWLLISSLCFSSSIWVQI
jgi:hypothetical protein